MGQKACKCVKAESADGDRGDVYALPENPPVQSTADSRDHSPPPAGATDGDVGVNRDGERKKRRFWRKFWKKRRRSAPGEREEQTIHQNTSAPSTADARDPSPRPAADVHEEEDENRDEGKKKSHREAQSEREEESDGCPEDQILETPELPNEDVNVIYEINSCQYEMGETLSKAGNISVYEATRVSDGLKVAVKIVQDVSQDFFSVPGHPKPLPREIALHILANEGEHVPEIVRLLDWEDHDDKYIMVLENPSPCMIDLSGFLESKEEKVTEDLARMVMWQAVKAIIECFKQGIFYGDIKLENFLINTETLDVKLIDFGHADLLKKTCYSEFLGTPDNCCPEFVKTGKYHAWPATVWSLGLMLYEMMCWTLPGTNTQEHINSKELKKDDLTKEFYSLIHACLKEDPHQRIQLKEILRHEWFRVGGVEMIDSRFEGATGKINSSQYKMGKMLGIGGFGSVNEATRVSDGLKVAVKIVRPGGYSDRICIPGHPNPLPREIALHILANKGEHVPKIIRLLDWEERDDKYIMVLEHPSPCMDLREFIDCHGGAIREKLAKSIMRQAIAAVIQCFIRGVFNMDIKLENFLINTETFHIKLIDFGCADLFKKTSYKTYMGTQKNCCPEMLETGECQALPATVWSLGLMLYRLVCKNLPEKYTFTWIDKKMRKENGLTENCCRFINASLHEDPHQRIWFKYILLHEWFQVR